MCKQSPCSVKLSHHVTGSMQSMNSIIVLTSVDTYVNSAYLMYFILSFVFVLVLKLWIVLIFCFFPSFPRVSHFTCVRSLFISGNFSCYEDLKSLIIYFIHSFIHSFIYLQANEQDIKISIKQTQSQPQYSVPHERRRVVTPLTRDQFENPHKRDKTG